MTTQNPLPPSVTTHIQLGSDPGGTHVWTDKDGRTHGALYLDRDGFSSLNFRDPAQVRDLIARLAALAGEMDAEVTRQRSPAGGLLAPLTCAKCGMTDAHLVAVYSGRAQCHNATRCAERVAARDAEAAQAGAR